jgi:hypothetical protein
MAPTAPPKRKTAYQNAKVGMAHRSIARYCNNPAHSDSIHGPRVREANIVVDWLTARSTLTSQLSQGRPQADADP